MHCDDGDELLETMADGFGEPGGRWQTVGEAARAVVDLVAARMKGRPTGTTCVASSPAGRCDADGVAAPKKDLPARKAQHGRQVATAGDNDSGRGGGHHEATKAPPTMASANAMPPSKIR